MPEDHRLALGERVRADARDEAGHRLRGVRRIEKDRFAARRELDGLARRVGRDPVAVADEPIVDVDGRSAPLARAYPPRRLYLGDEPSGDRNRAA